MSSPPPSMYSPLGNRRTYESLIDAGRWTVDNSESRFTRFTSPIRSILKGSHTPLRYNSPLFQHEQEKRRERLAQRRVSFAPDAHLRLFKQDDTPDISNRDVPNLIEEPEPTVMMTDAFASPLGYHQEDSLLLSRLSGSPSDRRKRRPDLFGSPPGNVRSPKRRSGGQPPSLLNRVYDETEDNGSDLTQYLSLQHQKGPRNIFEEDDDEDEDQEHTAESMVLTRTIIPPTSETVPVQTMNPLARNSPSPSPTQTPLTQTTSSPVTRESPSPSPPLPTVEHTIPTRTMDPFERASPLPSPSQTFESMILTGPVDPTAGTYRSPSPPPRLQATSPLVSRSPPLHQQNIDIEMDLEDQEEPAEENFEFDIAEDDNMEITHELPTYLSSNVYSPARSALSPFKPLQPQPQQELEQKSMSELYSPHRSFYLHDKSPLSQDRFSETIHTDRFISLEEANDDLLQEEFPETYQSFTDTPSLLNNIPLEEFLCIIGMTFDDIIPTNQLRRRSTYNIDYGSATVAEQAVAAASTLPQLELFQAGCSQLSQYIKTCKTTIEHIHETVSDANPQFFSEYNEASPQLRSQMGKRFLLIKNYARLKATITCYESWFKSLEQVLNTLKINHEKLMQDERSTKLFVTDLRKKVPMIEKLQDDLQRRLSKARIEEAEYNAIDHAQLSKLEQEIEQQRYSIQAFKKEADKLASIEFELIEKAVALEKRKSDLKEKIAQAEDVLVENECITPKDLVDAAELFGRCSEIHKWKLEKAENDIIQVNISEDINIVVDRTKLQQKKEDAVLIRMLDSRDRELGPLAELVHGLKIAAKNKWDMNEIIQDVAIYWNRVRMMQNELYKLQNRFWVDIDALEHANEPEEAGFTCQICVYSFMGKTKFTVSFQVNPKDILDYPFIDLSSLEVDINYGCIEQHRLEELLKKSISETGFIDLADTLRNILEQISIPPS